jgi:hypothetical protein
MFARFHTVLWVFENWSIMGATMGSEEHARCIRNHVPQVVDARRSHPHGGLCIRGRRRDARVAELDLAGERLDAALIGPRGRRLVPGLDAVGAIRDRHVESGPGEVRGSTHLRERHVVGEAARHSGQLIALNGRRGERNGDGGNDGKQGEHDQHLDHAEASPVTVPDRRRSLQHAPLRGKRRTIRLGF